MVQEIKKAEAEFSSLLDQPFERVRDAIRTQAYRGHTAGLCSGNLQCNLVILPFALADDFLRFCAMNPKPCPLVGVSQPGQPGLQRLGRQIDLRTDVPRYYIYKDGKLAGQCHDITDLWQDDSVAFAIGCSFTFEGALAAEGVSLRHVELNRTVPMYRTNIMTKAVGDFAGPMVVSMRPMKQADLKRVYEICALYPHSHGEPVHTGDPAAIGIGDIAAPDWGDAVPIAEDEVPVFWGCGVTSQVAIESARPALCITHAPGCMLITEINETSTMLKEQAVALEHETSL